MMMLAEDCRASRSRSTPHLPCLMAESCSFTVGGGTIVPPLLSCVVCHHGFCSGCLSPIGFFAMAASMMSRMSMQAISAS